MTTLLLTLPHHPYQTNHQMAQTSPPPLPSPNSQSQTIIFTTSPPPPSPPPPSTPSPPPPPPPSSSFTPFSFPNRPPLRVTSEFDSDTGIFFQKISSKFFNGLAKLKFSFESTTNGEISYPQVAIVTKNLDIRYDVVEKNAFVKGFFDVGPNLQLKAFHDVKAQQGELSMLANLSDPGYKFELTSFVPSVGLPKATLRFPCGELSLEEREDDEEKRVLSINGIAKGSILNGLCTAMYSNETLNLRYCYKDEEVSFIPSISLPSNAVSIAFKRRFGPADKLSYWYNFDTNSWSSVYKHTVGKDYKFKAGYDSEVRLGWASLWVGDEGGKAKTAPMKMKVQFMLQVPQDDIKTSALMFRVKKRWDI